MSRGTQKGSLLQNICSPTDFLDPHGHVLTEKSSIEGGNLLFPVGCTCWLVQFVLILLLNPQPSPPRPAPLLPTSEVSIWPWNYSPNSFSVCKFGCCVAVLTGSEFLRGFAGKWKLCHICWEKGTDTNLPTTLN